MTSVAAAPQDLRSVVSDEERARLHAVGHQHVTRLLVFAVLFAAGAVGAVWLAEGDVHWLLRVPFYLLAAASLHGISLFTHEGVHGTLSKNQLRNRLFAAVCAWPVLQNFSAYRVLHLRHHAHLGEAGDPDHYPNYTTWTWLERALYWGRLLAGYPVYVTAIPWLGVRAGTRSDRAWIAFELCMMVGLMAAVWWTFPSSWMVHGWLIPMVCINSMVNVRGMSQHTLLADPSDVVHGSRCILGNPLTRFFMCNENYHLEHHLFPRVPWYNLPRLHTLLQPRLHSENAPVIGSYLQFVREFIVATLRQQQAGTVTPK